MEGKKIMPVWASVVVAAGKGTRMKSKLPKVLHKLAGKPLIEHVLDAITGLGIERPLVILGHGRELVEEKIGSRVQVVMQAEQLGTGHALMQALPYLKGVDNVLVLSGDQPLLQAETLQALWRLHEAEDSSATVLTAMLHDPCGYGRVIKDKNQLLKIVEEKDATVEERRIQEINTGTYCFKVNALKEALAQIKPQNAQGEYYLTDVFSHFLEKGKKVLTFRTDDAIEAIGINSRRQLAEAEAILKDRILRYWMDEGVTITDPASTFIEAGVKLTQDVTLLPFTILRGATRIEEDAVIGPHVLLDSCTCHQGCQISHTVARDAVIGPASNVGPFAYLRPGTHLEEKVKVGDFVEIKNSFIGKGSKIPHLSYIGDASVGNSVNIGAGTITCNYDGVSKHSTRIGDQAFIGSNTNLVAPLEIGAGAMTGAGSTVTRNVPDHALVVERSQQVVKENWQNRRKK